MIYAASPGAVLLSEHRPVACVPSGPSHTSRFLDFAGITGVAPDEFA